MAFASALAVGFFLAPYLIRTLGKPRYDIWCVVESVLAYFYLLDMGVAACLVRYVAKHQANQDTLGLNRIASASLLVYLVAGLVVVVVGGPILLLLNPRLADRSPDPNDVLPFMLLMMANVALTLPLSLFPSILDGLQRFVSKSAVRIFFLALRTVGVVMAAPYGLFPVAVAYTAANLAEHVVMALICFRVLPDLRFSYRIIDRETLKQVAGYSRDAFLAMLAGRITLQTGAIVIGLILPAGQVTYYVTSGRLIEYAKTLLRTVTATLTPGVSAMEARGDIAGIRKIFLVGTRWMLYMAMPVNVGLLWFGKPFLERWVGEDFIAGSYPAMAVLSATLSIGIAQSVASRILYGVGRLKLFARMALAEAGLNLALTPLLIYPYGLVGVAVAVAVPNWLFCLAVIWSTAHYLGVTARTYFLAWLSPVVCVGLPSVIWVSQGQADAEWLSIFVGILSGLVPYAGLVAVVEWWRKRQPAEPKGE